MRLVNHASAYGHGIYFADHSSTAYDYCLRPDNAAAAQGFGGGGPAGFGAAGVPWARMAGLGGSAALAAQMAQMAAMGGGAFAFGNGMPGAAQHGGQQGGRVYKMIIARVALGRQALGQAGMRRPPDGYDSVNSGSAHATAGNPYCHVIFDNDLVYPEYLVTLRP